MTCTPNTPSNTNQQPTITQPTTKPITTTPTTKTTATFTRNLTLGSTGSDVKNLQIFLNAHGFTVSATGTGSSGHESTYYGPATKAALIKFQEANAATILTPNGLTKGTGFFGPATMKVVNGVK
jgi:peptidoglycan hydrolase-like protein with peptidoglycan-binding domain